MATESIEDIGLLVTPEDIQMVWNMGQLFGSAVVIGLMCLIFYGVFMTGWRRSSYGKQLKKEFWENYWASLQKSGKQKKQKKTQ